VTKTCFLIAFLSSFCSAGDWPAVRGGAQRAGAKEETLQLPYRVAWVRFIPGERFGTGFEPIASGGRLFLATHSGNLYCLNALNGAGVWRFRAPDPFVASPAVSGGAVVAADTGGGLYALEAASGRVVWQRFDLPGGSVASPACASGRVFVGSRLGVFMCLDWRTGAVLWKQSLGAPVRQTAAVYRDRVVVTAEDLRVWCFDAQSGKVLWCSKQLWGQSARDYYPVISRSGGRTYCIVRTSPADRMSHRIAQDRRFLCRQAGVDDSNWKKLAAWTQSPAARGTPALWAREQKAISGYLEKHPEAQTFFALDLHTGHLEKPAPVLWCGGCQGVGTPPVVLPGGKLFVLYRSAYGNWSEGVAPLICLGVLDLKDGSIKPVFHRHGRKPPWNTFWGTADESQNFVRLGSRILIVHQGTLSVFDLESGELRTLAGKRDTWGGFPNLPWARNEWHGPARSGVAFAGRRIYWQTGSRVLCLEPGVGGSVPHGAPIAVDKLSLQEASRRPARDRRLLSIEIEKSVREVLNGPWAPLVVVPGLGGKEFFFDSSADYFEALAWAYPHLSESLKARVYKYLEGLLREPSLFSSRGLGLALGKAREYHKVPEHLRTYAGALPRAHPFAGVFALWLWAERAGAWREVSGLWNEFKRVYEDFCSSGWSFDPKAGDRWANRYASSLFAFSHIAKRVGKPDYARKALRRAEALTAEIAALWREVAAHNQLPVFHGIAEWDGFRRKPGYLFRQVRPHCAKLSLFAGLGPELAERLLERKIPFRELWRSFSQLCPTWHLAGEERQVHYGENLFDPPDISLSAFEALAFLGDPSFEALARRVDIPFCEADLYYITKLALALDRAEK